MGCSNPQTNDVVNEFIVCGGYSNDKAVDVTEIHWTLRKYFRNIPMSISMIFAKFADTDCNGQISRKEFNRFISILDGVDVNDEQAFYQLIFKASDLNDNGIMEQNELYFVFSKLKIYIEDDSIFNNCPLTLTEFIKLMKKMGAIEKVMVKTTDIFADHSIFEKELQEIEEQENDSKYMLRILK